MPELVATEVTWKGETAKAEAMFVIVRVLQQYSSLA